MIVRLPVARISLRRLRSVSWRDALFVGFPALLLLIGGFWGAAQFIQPAPPSRLAIASGEAGGGYQRYAAQYRQVLARYGIDLVETPTSGTPENVALLRSHAVDAGLVQGGAAGAIEGDSLESLGALGYEPLWVFYREAEDTEESSFRRLSRLKGRRIAIGGANSGTRVLALDVLRANGIGEENSRLKMLGGLAAAHALVRGDVDAAFIVGPVNSAAVWTLLYAPGIHLLNFERAEAYVRMFPYLSKVVLPAGAVDLVRNIPPTDIALVAPTTTIAVSDRLHPALADLLVQAVAEVHGGPDLLHRAGEFPIGKAVDFPLSPRAARYFASGKPLLQRYLPFWAATFIDRTVVMLIPVVALLFPLVRFAPMAYGWRVRSRIYRRYGELKFLEAEVEAEPARHSRDEWLARLDAIEQAVNRMPTPLTFSDMFYTLRGHIDIVRTTVMKRTADFADPAALP